MSDRNGARKEECCSFAAGMLTVFNASTSDPDVIVGASEGSTSGCQSGLHLAGDGSGRRGGAAVTNGDERS